MVEHSSLKQAKGIKMEGSRFESKWEQFTTLKLECIKKYVIFHLTFFMVVFRPFIKLMETILFTFLIHEDEIGWVGSLHLGT